MSAVEGLVPSPAPGPGNARATVTTVAPKTREVTKNTDVIRDPWVGWFRGLWSGGAA